MNTIGSPVFMSCHTWGKASFYCSPCLGAEERGSCFFLATPAQSGASISELVIVRRGVGVDIEKDQVTVQMP